VRHGAYVALLACGERSAPKPAASEAIRQGKHFLLEKEEKAFARLSPAGPRQPSKSFLAPFFKKELLP
jgi:hypothetical protein